MTIPSTCTPTSTSRTRSWSTTRGREIIILGIDPGLNATGYGVIAASAGRLQFIAAGEVRPSVRQALSQRLACIHDALVELIVRHHPETAALEKIFTHHRYVSTATLMGHARGAACLAVQRHGLALAEYSPTQVKKSLTGSGGASKEQVGRMVAQRLRHMDQAWSKDATDALALAITHAHRLNLRRHLAAGMVG